MPPRKKLHPLVKALIVLLLLAGLGFLFVRSAQDTRAEPYQMAAGHLANWTLGIDTAADADGAAISLRPPPELPMNFFRQLFSRQMESLGTQSVPGIPLVLRREVPPSIDAERLLTLAREAGLEHARLQPRCVAYRRVSAMGMTRQLYFVFFDVPGFDRFRQAVAGEAGGAFDPKALSPVLLMAAQPDFSGWLPVVVDEARDCVASVTVE
jgi:hypothetical protein